ncbi:MAG: stage II sporulation protein P [Clostridium sp.]
MNNLRKRSNAGKFSGRDIKGRNSGKFLFPNWEYILIIGLLIIFLLRVNSVINSYKNTYVGLLNLGMPIVKSQIYSESEYSKIELPVKKVLLESLGLDNINLAGIIGMEVGYLKGAIANTPSKGNKVADIGIEEFKVSENTIAKLTPEEIAELNDVSKAYNPNIKKQLDPSKPEILIYHTHTMEHYSEADGQTTNNDFNVVGAGEILTKELEEGYGISVVHDKTNYTLPDYQTAYDRSRVGLQKNLSEFKDFKLVIDLHRDSLPRESVVANLNNQSLAKFMFVTSENVPTYDANQKIVDDLYEIGSSLFPELTRKPSIVEYPGGINGYNQGFAEGSMIIELGSHFNTAQEAKLTAKYIARILAEYLNA